MLSKATNTKVPKFLMTAAGEYAATATASNNSKPFMVETLYFSGFIKKKNLIKI
jgi:hypothetical protein